VRFALAIAAAVSWAPAVTLADPAAQLTGYETEIRNLSENLPTAQQLAAPDLGTNRLVDAEVSFGLGDYNAAATALFDFVNKPGPDAEAATYYLAESLYAKGDRGAALIYFTQLGNAATMNSRYYQPALGRLVELAIDSPGGDDAGATPWLSKLDAIPPGLRMPLVPYIRGKYAYSQGKYDEALAYFQDVPKSSDFDLQSQFFVGTIQINKQDLPRAIQTYTDLTERVPRTASDRRVMELAQLALGRLYYERDQFGKSIDSYLMVDRHSDLFPDALYEVSWVYVKNKQYDKALRALELLSRSEPDSARTPTIRILEGNLRIRKAQMIRSAQVEGTGAAADDPAIEYDKANQVFSETHDMYFPGYVALSHIIVDKADPSRYMAQLAGRSQRAFQIAAPLPDEAAVLIREEPGVQRLIGVDGDLADVRRNLMETRETIDELGAVVAKHDTFDAYPSLAMRRHRIATIQDALAKLRDDLADQQLQLVNPSGDLSRLTATRKQLSEQYRAQPPVDKTHTDNIVQASKSFDGIEKTADEVDAALDTAGAMAVALRVYPNIPDSLSSQSQSGLADAAKESKEIDDELADVRRELRLGRDLSQVEDDTAATRDARAKLTAAQDAEHRVLAGFASASRDPKKSQELAALGDRASRIASQLDQLDQQINGIADQGMQLTKAALDTERGNLAALEKELADDSAEEDSGANDVLGAGFADARLRLYEIDIRTDVGNVDVAWSQKEDTDDDVKRLTLARSRELKQLKDEFRDILEEAAPKPVEKHNKVDLPPPPTDANSNERVAPGNGTGATNPAVKPDQPKPTPDKKPGGSR
jgi:tetratricopeptide (TPR) repeat protein